MRKLLICLMAVVLMQLAAGCMFFPHTYDGSETFSNTMPQYSNTPSYMQDDPQPLDGKQ
jgi:uncharacterized protein YxeA